MEMLTTNLIHLEVKDVEEVQQQQGVEGDADSFPIPVRVIDESDLNGEQYIEIGDLNELMEGGTIVYNHNHKPVVQFQTQEIVDIGSENVEKLGVDTQEVEMEGLPLSGGNSNQNQPFPCSLCPERFDKKLLLNNHMKNKHGVNYVFTEKGRKVKLVRLPEDESAADAETMNEEQEQQQVSEAIEEDQHEESGTGGLGCGYACKIETIAYQKALQRNQIPFAAFIPIYSPNSLRSNQVYLLKIKDYGGHNQLLEPATRNDVIAAFLRHTKNGSELEETVPIVAIVQQSFNTVTQSTEISISPPTEEFKYEHNNVKIISQDRFTSLAFANPNLDPFAETESECDDEEPLPPKIKGKKRGRKSKKETQKAEKEKIPIPATKPNGKDVFKKRVETAICSKSMLDMPKLTSEVDDNPVGAETATIGTDESSEMDSNPPKLVPEVVVKQETAAGSEAMDVDTASPALEMQALILKTPSPKKRVKRAKSKSKSGNVQVQSTSSDHLLFTPPNHPPNNTPRAPSRRKPRPSPIEKGFESDDECDRYFIPTPTCAPNPKRKATAPPVKRGRGRPRKLRFDNCTENPLDDDKPAAATGTATTADKENKDPLGMTTEEEKQVEDLLLKEIITSAPAPAPEENMEQVVVKVEDLSEGGRIALPMIVVAVSEPKVPKLRIKKEKVDMEEELSEDVFPLTRSKRRRLSQRGGGRVSESATEDEDKPSKPKKLSRIM